MVIASQPDGIVLPYNYAYSVYSYIIIIPYYIPCASAVVHCPFSVGRVVPTLLSRSSNALCDSLSNCISRLHIFSEKQMNAVRIYTTSVHKFVRKRYILFNDYGW